MLGDCGSALVANLNCANSVQIALRLPAPDRAKAREIPDCKGVSYQALLKMLVHGGCLAKRVGK
jgi:hypothetical protein